jgi:hypothetical protein
MITDFVCWCCPGQNYLLRNNTHHHAFRNIFDTTRTSVTSWKFGGEKGKLPDSSVVKFATQSTEDLDLKLHVGEIRKNYLCESANNGFTTDSHLFTYFIASPVAPTRLLLTISISREYHILYQAHKKCHLEILAMSWRDTTSWEKG